MLTFIEYLEHSEYSMMTFTVIALLVLPAMLMDIIKMMFLHYYIFHLSVLSLTLRGPISYSCHLW